MADYKISSSKLNNFQRLHEEQLKQRKLQQKEGARILQQQVIDEENEIDSFLDNSQVDQSALDNWQKSMYQSSHDNIRAAKRAALSKGNLAGIFNRALLNPDAMQLLSKYYDDSNIDDDTIDVLGKQLIDCIDGQELVLLNAFFDSTPLTTVQQYFTLTNVYHQLKSVNSKPEFTKNLEEYTRQFEDQNSGYLFDFFALTKNPKITENLSKEGIEALAMIVSADEQLIIAPEDLKTTVEVIDQISGGDFSHIVSIYMQARVHQLKLLQSIGDKNTQHAKLHEILIFCRNLTYINSLNHFQEEFISKNFLEL